MIPDVELTILGNTSSIPMHGRHHTAQILRFGQELMLIDCGEGTQLQLRKYKIKTAKLSAIFISHLHGDHYLGLIGLLSSYHLAKRSTPLTVFGPRGLDEIIITHFRWSNTRLCYPLTFIPTQTEEMALLLDRPEFTVSSFPLRHRIPTTGFLIQEKEGLRSLIKEKLEAHPLPIAALQQLRSGQDYLSPEGELHRVIDYCQPLPRLRSYAFCSDTAFYPELAPLLQGVDMLYHEATFAEADAGRASETYHSTAKQAATMAQLCGAKSLLLGHFSSRYPELSELLAEAQSIFPNAQLSEEGISYTLTPSHD